MKKILCLTLTVILMLGTFSLGAFAAQTSCDVYVTISDADGRLAIAQEKITVTDIDSDGALTVNDALYLAHEAKYTGGAAAGYESAVSTYGLSLNKLWGTANGVSYGYCVNNKSALALSDTVKNGDFVNAYVYTDLVTWSDTYSYFDVNTKNVSEGESFTLTLSAAGYDASYNPLVLPVQNATITVDGTAVQYKTNEQGAVTLTLSAGDHIISAVSDTQTLVPPVCKITVNVTQTTPDSSPADSEATQTTPDNSPVDSETTETQPSESPDTSDNTVVLALVLALCVLCAAVIVKRRYANEK